VALHSKAIPQFVSAGEMSKEFFIWVSSPLYHMMLGFIFTCLGVVWRARRDDRLTGLRSNVIQQSVFGCQMRKKSDISVSSPLFFMILGFIYTHLGVVWRAPRDDRLAGLRSKDIPQFVSVGEMSKEFSIWVSSPLYLMMLGFIFTHLGVVWRAQRDDRLAALHSKVIPQFISAGEMSKEFFIWVSSPLYHMMLGFIFTCLGALWRARRDDRPMGLHSKDIQQFVF